MRASWELQTASWELINENFLDNSTRNLSWYTCTCLHLLCLHSALTPLCMSMSKSFLSLCCCLEAKSHLTLGNSLDCSMPSLSVPHYLPKFAQTHVHWVGDAIQPSHHLPCPRSFLQSFSASGSFPMSQFFASGGQSIGASASASASVLPMNIQGWFPLGLTGLISLQSKGLLRVLSNIIIGKYQFFIAQSSSWSNSHNPYMTTGKTIALTIWTFIGSDVSAF